MALLLLTVIAAVTAAGAERPSAGHAAGDGRCQTTAGRVVADASEVLVTVVSSTEDPGGDRKAKFFACLKKTGTRRRLDRGLKTQFEVFAPKGRFVVAAAYDSIDAYMAVDLIDVASGVRYKLLRSDWEAGNGDVDVVLLKRNGSVAFLTGTEPDILYRCEIGSCYTPGRRARLAELDNGRIPLASVRLRGGSTIVWRNASGTRSAPLR